MQNPPLSFIILHFSSFNFKIFQFSPLLKFRLLLPLMFKKKNPQRCRSLSEEHKKTNPAPQNLNIKIRSKRNRTAL